MQCWSQNNLQNSLKWQRLRGGSVIPVLWVIGTCHHAVHHLVNVYMSDSPSRHPAPRMKEDRQYYSQLIDKVLEIAKEVTYYVHCLTVHSWVGRSLTLLLHLGNPCTPRLTACFGRQHTGGTKRGPTASDCRCLGVCRLETKGNKEMRTFRVLKNWDGRKETRGVSGSVMIWFIRVRKRKGHGGQLRGLYQESSEAAEAKLRPHSSRGSMCSVCPKNPLMALGQKMGKKDKRCHLEALSDRWAEWTKEGAFLGEKVNGPVQYARYHPIQKTLLLTHQFGQQQEPLAMGRWWKEGLTTGNHGQGNPVSTSGTK